MDHCTDAPGDEEDAPTVEELQAKYERLTPAKRAIVDARVAELLEAVTPEGGIDVDIAVAPLPPATGGAVYVPLRPGEALVVVDPDGDL